jgi:GNAT superfamily N-acetyltransferase
LTRSEYTDLRHRTHRAARRIGAGRFTIVGLSSAIRDQALHPIRDLPPVAGWERIERDGLVLLLDPYPTALLVEPIEIPLADVQAAVGSARRVAEEWGRSQLAWWVGPGRRGLEAQLEAAGLVHADTPGLEAVESGMVLLQRPRAPIGGAIAVRETSTYEEYVAATQILMEAFDFSEAIRAHAVAGLSMRWEEHVTPSNPGRQYIASIDGRIVGTAVAVLGSAGVNLFGGAVLEEARGLGVYRALIAARWETAVTCGTPALTVQAGRMAKPILKRIGFAEVGRIHIYVDTIED